MCSNVSTVPNGRPSCSGIPASRIGPACVQQSTAAAASSLTTSPGPRCEEHSWSKSVSPPPTSPSRPARPAGHALEAPGDAGRPLLLPQGRHARLHHGGLRLPRRPRRLRGGRGEGHRRQPRRRQRRTGSSPTSTSSPFTLLADTEKTRLPELRGLEREEHVRQEVDGRRAHDVRHRRRRGSSARSSRRSRSTATPTRCSTRSRSLVTAVANGSPISSDDQPDVSRRAGVGRLGDAAGRGRGRRGGRRGGVRACGGPCTSRR